MARGLHAVLVRGRGNHSLSSSRNILARGGRPDRSAFCDVCAAQLCLWSALPCVLRSVSRLRVHTRHNMGQIFWPEANIWPEAFWPEAIAGNTKL
eukprot:2589054-Heterocapsa_arctica.AAC.1